MTTGRYRVLMLLMIALLVLPLGCSGRKVSSSAGDQTMVAGPPKTPPTQPPRAERPAQPMPAIDPPTLPPAIQQPVPPAPEEVATTTPEPLPPGLAEQPASPPEEGMTITPETLASQPVMPASPRTVTPAAELLGTGLVDVYFDFDRFVIRSDAKSLLEANARMLKSKNEWKLLIEGHCDERGTADYNLVLGERRAQSVKRYLSDLGVPDSTMQIISYGKERPFCLEHSDDCWQQNRRAHFVLK